MKTGWVTKRLGEVCERIVDGDHNPPIGIPFSNNLMLSSKNVLCGELTFEAPRYLSDTSFEECNGRTDVRKGDVLLTIVGTIGRACVFDSDKRVTFQRSVAVLKPLHTIVDSYYLMYVLWAKSSDLEKRGHGAAQKGLYLKELSSIEIPIPPLAEQKRIVAKIDAAFEKIDRLKANAERNLANAKELFQSALNEAMRPKPGWVETRLGEVCSKIGSGATPKGGRKSYCSSGVSLIRSMNVYDHAFKYDELAHINESQAHELDNVEISKNDVLINITGASIARCCVVPADVLPARVNQHVSILRISDDTEVAADFLCYRLISFEAKEALLKIGEAGSTRQALTKGDLESFVVSLPGLGEQKKIIDAIAAAEKSYLKLQSNYTRLIADCAEMRQAVLKEAFEGRL